ncbi:MAG: class II fructose-bisphosphate aldolase, partial [Jatrophihabitans sp.]
ALAEASSGEVALHLDHVEDLLLLRHAADCGVHSVMIDASRLVYAANVAATAAAVAWAHDRGIWTEAELGEVGGKDGAHAPGVRTDPAEAAAFVAATGVDALAVAVGSSHAMTERTATLDLTLIAELRDRLDVPLVLHGSSGVSNDELRQAIGAGMVKINIGTLLNVSFTARVRAELDASKAVVDPRRYLGPARQAVADVVAGVLTDLSRAWA